MYKITVKGEAQTDYPHLEELHGIDCQDNFSEYFDDRYLHYDSIMEKELSGGYMEFRFEDGKLWTYTIYHTEEELTKEELDTLLDYTRGQWSDGIGEGFEQEPCYYDKKGNEIYISPWFSGQKATIEQHKLNQ